MGQTILITGAGGYIPTVLIKKLLELDYKVIGIDNGFGRTLDGLIEFAPHPNFSFIKGGFAQESVMDKVAGKFDIAILAGALVGEPIVNKFPDLAMSTNAHDVKTFCARFPDAPIIYTGTGSSYGKVEGVCTEESPTNPLSLYAISKLYAEDAIKHHNPHVIYRFATAFGVGGCSYRLDLLVNDLTYQAVRNKTITIFQADYRRTFCHVRDLADSLLFAIQNFEKLEGQTYNVGHNDNNWSKRRLAEFIKSKTNCSVFYGDEGYKDSDMRDYECSFDKIGKMGWMAKIGMEQGIEELIKVVPLLDMKNQYNFVG